MKRHRWKREYPSPEIAAEYPDEFTDICQDCGIEREFVLTGTGGPDGYWLRTKEPGSGHHARRLPPCPE